MFGSKKGINTNLLKAAVAQALSFLGEDEKQTGACRKLGFVEVQTPETRSI